MDNSQFIDVSHLDISLVPSSNQNEASFFEQAKHIGDFSILSDQYQAVNEETQFQRSTHTGSILASQKQSVINSILEPQIRFDNSNQIPINNPKSIYSQQKQEKQQIPSKNYVKIRKYSLQSLQTIINHQVVVND